MTTNTENYRFTHGHAPRGYGLWLFAIERRPGEYTEFQATGLYTQARKAALAEARVISGARRVIVMP